MTRNLAILVCAAMWGSVACATSLPAAFSEPITVVVIDVRVDGPHDPALDRALADILATKAALSGCPVVRKGSAADQQDGALILTWRIGLLDPPFAAMALEILRPATRIDQLPEPFAIGADVELLPERAGEALGKIWNRAISCPRGK